MIQVKRTFLQHLLFYKIKILQDIDQSVLILKDSNIADIAATLNSKSLCGWGSVCTHVAVTVLRPEIIRVPSLPVVIPLRHCLSLKWSQAGELLAPLSLLPTRNTGVTGVCSHAWFFTWVLRTQNQMSMLVQKIFELFFKSLALTCVQCWNSQSFHRFQRSGSIPQASSNSHNIDPSLQSKFRKSDRTLRKIMCFGTNMCLPSTQCA